MAVVGLFLSACGAEEDRDNQPTLTVTGFGVGVGSTVTTSFAPTQAIVVPALPDRFIAISATLRDNQQLRGIRYVIEPDFAVSVPSSPSDSVWRTTITSDTFSRAQVTLTNRRFVNIVPEIRQLNETNGGPYRLRITVTDAEGNTSEESVHRIEVRN